VANPLAFAETAHEDLLCRRADHRGDVEHEISAVRAPAERGPERARAQGWLAERAFGG
jgi:hypothetical protein